MSREAARTTTKSNEISNEIQQTVVKLCHRKPQPRLHGSPRYPQMFLKNMLKSL